MEKYTILDFINVTGQKTNEESIFEIEKDRLLKINLDGQAWAKIGTMVAYYGNIKFVREGIFEHGIGKFFKKAVTGESMKLMKIQGKGSIYLADSGKKISILNLKDDSIFVNSNDILAFEDKIQWDIKFMKKVTAMLSGGLFNVKLEGNGMIAITTYYDPLTLKVTPETPIITDPNATVAWSATLSPDLKTDISFKTFLGRGSGESIQMKFEGEGFVIIQPYEEAYFQKHKSS